MKFIILITVWEPITVKKASKLHFFAVFLVANKKIDFFIFKVRGKKVHDFLPSVDE